MKNNGLYSDRINNRAEVLAPAGSLEICKAVIRAGADAVYLGGTMFGARAFAGNLNYDEMLEAIGYAHRFGRRIYLTVNTLLKEDEISKRLVDYIRPYYEAGLDAVIVQDLGVLRLLRREFPDLPLHASTQMTQTGYAGSKLLMDASADRVVTSREMTLEEINILHKKLPELEIESFVHGALCYCYSGQCLLSSFCGGRSGNRGRCAQPCRLPYDAYDPFNNQKLSSESDKYLLSPKDMCALSIIPDILDAGVYSLKIEGRMKNVTYAAFVTHIYRKYVDMYLKNGRSGYKVLEEDVNALMDIYNRGAFTRGYYDTKPGKEMISVNRPNHYGVKALKVLSNISGRITFLALVDINAGDVFELPLNYALDTARSSGADNSFTAGKAYRAGETFVVNLPQKLPLYKGREIYRMKNEKLIEFVNDNFCKKEPNINLGISVMALKGNELTVMAHVLDSFKCHELKDDIYACITGEAVTKALKTPVSEDDIKKAFVKIGNPYYTVRNIDITMDEDIFIPASSLKSVRRQLLELLDNEIADRFTRRNRSVNEQIESDNDLVEQNASVSGFKKDNSTNYVSVHLHGINGIKSAYRNRRVSAIYMEYTAVLNAKEWQMVLDIKKNCEAEQGKIIEWFIVLPHILREDNKELFSTLVEKSLQCEPKGFVVRNLEELGMLAEIKKDALTVSDFPLYIITDASIYITNSIAANEIKQMVTDSGFYYMYGTISVELTHREISDMLHGCNTCDTFELIVYGNVPMMVSRQCVRKTLGFCDHSNSSVKIISSNKTPLLVKSMCDFCYSITLKEVLNYTGAKELTELSVRHRYEFTDETEKEIELILKNGFNGGSEGHFYKKTD